MPEVLVVWVYWPPVPRAEFPCDQVETVLQVVPDSVRDLRREYGDLIEEDASCVYVCEHMGRVIE